MLARQLGVKAGPKEWVSMREVVGRWAGEKDGDGELEPGQLKKALEELGGRIEGLKTCGERRQRWDRNWSDP